MLFGGSHFGFGIRLGLEEIQQLRDKFPGDRDIIDILQHDVYPKIDNAIRPTRHPSYFFSFEFILADHHIKDGYFLMLPSTSYMSDRDDPFTSIESDVHHGTALALYVGEIGRLYVDEFQKITGITKKWEWALISSFY